MFEIIDNSFHYLDPGTGSYLMQVILAAGITVGIYFRNVKDFLLNSYYKIKKLLNL